MQEELISIIIPVYNAERYINRTIESVIGQTYSNWELLLVNDGSTDASKKICDELARQDERIRVFHIPNSGAAIARNIGIEKSLGKYICFIDSDDIVSRDYVLFLYNNLINLKVDMMICGYRKVYQLDKAFTNNNRIDVHIWSKEDALEELLYRKSFTSGPWCKLVRTDVVRNNPFPEGKLYEDQGCVYKWIAASEKIGYNNAIHYLYLMHEDSCQHSDFDIRKMNHVEFSQEIVRFINDKYPKVQNAAVNRLFTSAVIIFRLIPRGKYQKEYEYLKRIISESRGIVVKDQKAKKTTRLLALISYIGVDVLPFMGIIYDKIILGKLKIRMRY